MWVETGIFVRTNFERFSSPFLGREKIQAKTFKIPLGLKNKIDFLCKNKWAKMKTFINPDDASDSDINQHFFSSESEFTSLW